MNQAIDPVFAAALRRELVALASTEAVDQARVSPGNRLPAGLRVVFATLVMVLFFITAAVAQAVLTNSHDSSAASPSPTPRSLSSQFEALPSRFALATAGPLAHDSAWLAGLRRQITAQQRFSSRHTNWQRVLWAGDVGDHRVAMVAFTGGTGPWTIAMASGPRGAAAGAMQLSGPLNLKGGDDGGRSDALTTQIALADGTSAASGGTVFVPAPTAREVDVATEVHLGPDRRVSTQWRPLTRAGAVWTGQLSGAEATYGGLRIVNQDGTVKGYSLPVEQAVHEKAWVATALAPVVHGVDRVSRARLVTALTSTLHYGLLPGMSIEQGRVAQLSDGSTLAAIVVRTPQGGYLVGACNTGSETKGSSWTTCSQGLAPAPAAGSQLLAVLDDGSTNRRNRRVVVIAPGTATHVTLAGVSAPVTDGVARLVIPSGQLRATATATDATGHVLATASAALNTGGGSTLWNDLAQHRVAG